MTHADPQVASALATNSTIFTAIGVVVGALIGVFGSHFKFYLDYRKDWRDKTMQAYVKLFTCWVEARNIIAKLLDEENRLGKSKKIVVDDLQDHPQEKINLQIDEKNAKSRAILAELREELDELYGKTHQHISEIQLYSEDPTLFDDIYKFNKSFFRPEPRWHTMTHDEANVQILALWQKAVQLSGRVRTHGAFGLLQGFKEPKRATESKELVHDLSTRKSPTFKKTEDPVKTKFKSE